MALELFLNLISEGSYLAVFLSSFVIASTVMIPIIPVPSYVPIILGVGIGMNPLLVGLVGGVGSALGELIAYFVGFGGTAAIEKFEHHIPKFLKRFEKFYSNIGFNVILVCAFIPFPFDLIGILSGASQYDVKKFFAALLIGRTLRSLLLAYTGVYIIQFGSDALNFMLHIFG
ncbi:MAG: VTT domain-containing protein [Candidatus Aenigmarchaeota archaeon]|nr:VTT domain-containing protein [Candidatus Aenigmarchaeota archaeon]